MKYICLLLFVQVLLIGTAYSKEPELKIYKVSVIAIPEAISGVYTSLTEDALKKIPGIEITSEKQEYVIAYTAILGANFSGENAMTVSVVVIRHHTLEEYIPQLKKPIDLTTEVMFTIDRQEYIASNVYTFDGLHPGKVIDVVASDFSEILKSQRSFDELTSAYQKELVVVQKQ